MVEEKKLMKKEAGAFSITSRFVVPKVVEINKGNFSYVDVSTGGPALDKGLLKATARSMTMTETWFSE